MKDRQPAYPGRYKASLTSSELAKLQAGQEFQITLTRDDSPTVPGTPYSKAAVLPDSLASVICPGVADPTPADALAHLVPGYKFGPYSVATQASLEAVLNSVLALMSDGTSRSFTVNSTSTNSTLVRNGIWFMTLNRESETQATVMAARATNTEKVMYMGFNALINGAWGEWEWLNPHMSSGSEYRTVFRWGSNPVYVKTFSFGALPSSGSKTKSHGIEDIHRIVLCSLYSTGTEGSHLTHSDLIKGVHVDGSDVVVTVNEDLSDYTASVFLVYSKEI